VESTLLRALMANGLSSAAVPGTRPLSNGGRELAISEHGVERLFRMKKASRDQRGLRVLASSDSVLSTCGSGAVQGSLFPGIVPERVEQWVLAFVVNLADQTITEVVAARAVGFVSAHPGRLLLTDEVNISLGADLEPPFRSGDEDLRLPEEPDVAEPRDDEETG
jgi:hypothetical protein